MRGRTNINGGGNVVVNGIPKEFTVAENCTIGKGNFVEVAYIGSKNQFSEREYRFADIIEVKDGLFIARERLDKNIICFSYKNNVLRICSTYDTNGVTAIFRLEDNLFLGYDMNNPFTFEVDTENMSLTNVKELGITGLTDAARMSETHIITYTLSTSSKELDVCVLDVTDHKNITVSEIIKCDFSAGYSYGGNTILLDTVGSAIFLGTTSNSIWVILGHINTSENRINRDYLEFTISEDLTSISYACRDHEDYEYNENLYSYSINNVPLGEVCIADNTYILCSYTKTSYIKKKYNGEERQYHLIDIGQKKKVAYKFDRTSRGGSYLIAISENVWCVIETSSEYAILNFNEEEKTFYLSKTRNAGGEIGTWIAFVKDKELVTIYFSGSTYTIPFTIVDKDIVKGEDQNIVKPYDGKQSAIGFAKTGGTAGEKIKVYVPKEIG